MTPPAKIKSLARKLFQLSLDGRGRVSPERVSAILACLDKSPPPGLPALLRAYKPLVAAQIERNTARVEHAGPLPEAAPAALAAALEKLLARPVEAVTSENPALLAGLRVRVGDDLFENNAAARLAALGTTRQFY